MKYPTGFPDGLKPRLDKAILGFRYIYPLAGDAAKRIDSTLYSYVNMACEAVESGELEIGLAYSGLKEFAFELLEDHANNTQQEWWTEKIRKDFLAPLEFQITWSIEWYGYLDRFAKLAEKKSIKPTEIPLEHSEPELFGPEIRGERDPTVAARRTELRNMLRSGKTPIILSVCKKWDSVGIKVPEAWVQEGITTWQQAHRQPTHRNRVKKLVSKDSAFIKSRSG